MTGVVVERNHARGARRGREREQIAQRRVPPADAAGVLGRVVLRVVDEQAGVGGELEARRPLRLPGKATSPARARGPAGRRARRRLRGSGTRPSAPGDRPARRVSRARRSRDALRSSRRGARAGRGDRAGAPGRSAATDSGSAAHAGRASSRRAPRCGPRARARTAERRTRGLRCGRGAGASATGRRGAPRARSSRPAAGCPCPHRARRRSRRGRGPRRSSCCRRSASSRDRAPAASRACPRS